MTTTAPPPRAATSPAGPAPAAGAGGFTHRQILTVLVGLLMGMFLAALDQTVVSTAIRTIADDLQGYDLQAWATTAFLITSTISTPLYGKLSDIYGRKPFYLAAISIFVIGSALCGLAGSMYQLAAFRAVQGVGAGGLMSLAFAILGDLVSPRERARYQAYFMAVFGSSSVLGPLIGGLLAGQSSLLGVTGWRWIFYVNVPIGIAALAVVYRTLNIPHTARPHRIDWSGAALLVVGLVPLLIVAEQGRTWGWGSAGAIVCYAVGVVGLAAFVAVERRMGDEALLPLRMFATRTYAVGVSASFIVGIGMFGALLLLPQYLQVVRGSSPTAAGLQTLPLMLGIISASAVSGRVISRTGRYKLQPVIGTLAMTAALVLFATIGVRADASLWLTMLCMLVFGAGLGLNMQPVILAVQNAVNPRDMGVATSAVTFFRQIGGTLGAAVFLSLLFSLVPGRIRDALATASATPDFQRAAADPAQAQLLATAGSGSLSDTSFISQLDAVLAAPFKTGFASTMDTIFLIAAGVMVLGFLVVLRLPELPLRTTGGVQAQAEEAGAPAAVAAAVPAGQVFATSGAVQPGDAGPALAAPEQPSHPAHPAHSAAGPSSSGHRERHRHRA